MFRVVALRLLEAFFRRPWRTILPIILFTILGVVYYVTKVPMYFTVGVMNVNEEIELGALTQINETGYAWVTPAEATMEQIGELMQTDSFVRAIISATPLENQMSGPIEEVGQLMEEVREGVWVESRGPNQLAIVASWDDAVTTHTLVESTVESYLLWHIRNGLLQTSAAEQFFTDTLSQYKSDLDETRKELEDYLLVHPEPLRGERPAIEKLQISSLQSNINLAEQRYVGALGKEENARVAAATTESVVRQRYQVVDEPRMPELPETSKKQAVITVLVFSVVGTLISILTVVGSAVLDRSFRFPVDVVHTLELPVLAAVPTGEIYERTTEKFAYAAPDPVETRQASHRRARLIPLVEPPTLIIMPDEAENELARIANERNRHGTTAEQHRNPYGGQERQHANGFTNGHVDSNPRIEDLPTTVLGRGSNR